MRQVPEETLQAIQRHFHAVIRGRVGYLIDRNKRPLPELAPLLTSKEAGGRYVVPGMYGCFAYWLEGEGEQTKLITESSCRIAGGSAQRHEITAQGSVLVAQGFDI